MRHAAVAAQSGVCGRHNQLLNALFGTRMAVTVTLTVIPLSPAPPVKENLGTHCNLCVTVCSAFDREYTDERLFF